MYQVGLDYEETCLRRQELLREASEQRLEGVLREGSERRRAWRLALLGWELRRYGERVLKLGTATAFLGGLSVILALVFGVATTAMGANGNPFLLGKKNVASAISTLVKKATGPALKLQVGAGQPPLAVNSQARVANLNADKLDGKDFSAFEAQEVLDTTGALPREGTFTSKGGTLVISASGSGFRGDGTSAKVGNIGMKVLVDGAVVGLTDVYANERNSHRAFVDEVAVVPGRAVGQHTIRLEESYATGTCNTANEQPSTYCTDTDFNDHFMVTVVEIPD